MALISLGSLGSLSRGVKKQQAQMSSVCDKQESEGPCCINVNALLYEDVESRVTLLPSMKVGALCWCLRLSLGPGSETKSSSL